MSVSQTSSHWSSSNVQPKSLETWIKGRDWNGLSTMCWWHPWKPMQTSSRSDGRSRGWTLELCQWYSNFPSATNCVRNKSSVSCSSNHHLDISSHFFFYSYIQKHTRLILPNIALQFPPTACLILAKQILWGQYECIWWEKKVNLWSVTCFNSVSLWSHPLFIWV